VDVSGASKPHRLATPGGDDACPVISHRGHRLAYVEMASHSGIWRLEVPAPGAKAKPPEKFIASTRNDNYPQFSPDGRKVAFESDRSGGDEIWICDPDGTNLVQLTSLGGPNIGPCDWSPDGSRLAFDANIEGHAEAFVMNARGGIPRRMTLSSYSANPSWSRDGHWILFDSSTALPDFCKVPAEGGPPVVVKQKVGWWAPRESPDGKFIYADEDAAGGDTNLVRVPVGGGEKQLVTKSLGDPFGYALVDGGVYFISKPDPKSGYSLQFLNTTTGKARQIISIANPSGGLTVSPDHRWILFAQAETVRSNLMLVENFH
jgi:dipeptidyl aminopeptidase/acylaminoacyl peptidase